MTRRDPDDAATVGVIGVGSMGTHHARVYNEVQDARLYGVVDADEATAREVASAYDTHAVTRAELLDAADAVSVAAPTEYHFELTRECIDHGVDVLVEKPFVRDVEAGRELVRRADRRDVLLQVGHVERFNPAFRTIERVAEDLSIIALEARRLGPPVERFSGNVVFDLLIHDVDIIQALVDADVDAVAAAGTDDRTYVTATLEFDDGTIARLTASRATQRKIRNLQITADRLHADVDYVDQTVELHRQSVPEYVPTNEGVRYRHEGVTERPMVDKGEPLRNELEAFVRAVRTREGPVVTGETGLRAIELAGVIEERAFDD